MNRNRKIRLDIIDKCLSNGGRLYTINDIMEEVNKYLIKEVGVEGVSRKTVYNDIEYMRSIDGYHADINVRKEGRYSYYQYADPDFSINNTPLSENQLAELRNILKSLRKISYFPIDEWLFKIRDLSLLSEEEEETKEYISYEHNPDYQGIDHFLPLYKAIINEQVLLIKYRKFTGKEHNFVFHPYFLKQFNQRWYIMGINDEEREKDWVLPLDRIQSVEHIDRDFLEVEKDYEDIYYNIIGVTNYEDAEVEKIVMKFDASARPYLDTKPLHATQKVRENDDDTINIEIKVKQNYELKSLIRSFGSSVEVLEPESLRKEMVEEYERCIERYSK